MPNHLKDISGQKFGRWTVCKHVGNGRWECKCECDESAVVRGSHLKDGTSRSCGCLKLELTAERMRKSMTTHGMYGAPEYKIWAQMRARCTNPEHPSWRYYGGRGVRVCAAWEKFENFIHDMGRRPSDRHSIDRTDNGLLYSKETCRWATRSEQANNTRRNVRIAYQGRTKTLTEWARTFGVNRELVRGRLRLGWNIEEAIRGRLS